MTRYNGPTWENRVTGLFFTAVQALCIVVGLLLTVFGICAINYAFSEDVFASDFYIFFGVVMAAFTPGLWGVAFCMSRLNAIVKKR